MAATGEQGTLLSALGDVPDCSHADGRLEVRLNVSSARLGRQDQGDPIPGHTDEGIGETKSLAGQDPQEAYLEEGNSRCRAGNKHDEEVEIQNGGR
jgi:hypothetical protein